MENPFAAIDARLSNLESLMQEIFDHVKKGRSVDNDILAVPEAAELLKIKEPTLYGKVSKKTIPYMKDGSRLYFSRTELLDHLKNGRKSTAKEIQEEAHLFIKKKGR